ncbi:aspartate carbamoyltransferase catalytic subunit [Defluviitalea phaphyphila]|uniref:aspartate carbamoyltransferase catalytic subunit n=1 Tax=Defluviitalea phaphyphila TaxID=1473580 RepID=UPI0007DC2A08|nr:aspartate carbamoyltransferase catalytic subunit [Defluviitalea phaphyphila]
MITNKDILGIRNMNSDEILQILETAEIMKKRIENKEQREKILKDFSIVTLFYENSTRTKMSFTLAAKYLGANIVDLGVSTSSVNKGESLVDTGVTLDQMGTDIMIIRHSMSGAANVLARNVNASVINAGDGVNEHPTQALLDLFTIYEKKKNFKDLKVVIIGDITHSRVARSNIFGLKKLGANVVVAGPSTLISKNMECIGAKVTTDIKEAIYKADVVMGLRIQLERQKGGLFPDIREYRQMFGINKELMKYAKEDAILMHPGPVNRGIELSTEIIDGDQSVINEQVKNGVAVRMALLYLLSERRKGNEDINSKWKNVRSYTKDKWNKRYIG